MVKKREMHKLALFSSKSRDKAKKSGTAAFLTSKIGLQNRDGWREWLVNIYLNMVLY